MADNRYHSCFLNLKPGDLIYYSGFSYKFSHFNRNYYGGYAYGVHCFMPIPNTSKHTELTDVCNFQGLKIDKIVKHNKQ